MYTRRLLRTCLWAGVGHSFGLFRARNSGYQQVGAQLLLQGYFAPRPSGSSFDFQASGWSFTCRKNFCHGRCLNMLVSLNAASGKTKSLHVSQNRHKRKIEHDFGERYVYCARGLCVGMCVYPYHLYMHTYICIFARTRAKTNVIRTPTLIVLCKAWVRSHGICTCMCMLIHIYIYIYIYITYIVHNMQIPVLFRGFPLQTYTQPVVT